MLSVRYIMSELEEIDREDNFRLKRFKELKTKKTKGADPPSENCYCDKKPGKGDDFICLRCQEEEEEGNKSKNKTDDPKAKICMSEVIGDKASTLSTANQKRLDDLTAHLEKVISLTSQCKTEGLVSPSVDTFIYACKEIRCKIEGMDHQQQSFEPICTQTPQDVGCDACGEVTSVQGMQNVSCEVFKEIQDVQPPKKPCRACVDELQSSIQDVTEDSLGYFETKFKEIKKVIKSQNIDGTISEEKQVITVKTERKHSHKPNVLGGTPCCKIDSFDSGSPFDVKSEKDSKVCCKDVTRIKSQDTSLCMQKDQTNTTKSSNSDTKAKIKYVPSIGCKLCYAGTNSLTPPAISNTCCNKACPSLTRSNKSKVSVKSSKKFHNSLTPPITSNTCCNKICSSLTGSNKSKVSVKSSKKSYNSLTPPVNSNTCCKKTCPSLIGSNKSKVSVKSSKKSNNSLTPPVTSNTCCIKTCPSLTGSNKSKVSVKSIKKSNVKLKNQLSKKDVSCACTTETTLACCDPIWKDVCCSTSDLAESFEEAEEECICVQEADVVEPLKKSSKHSVEKKSATSITSLCCDKDTELEEKKSSRKLKIKGNTKSCAMCTESKSKDVSTSLSNIELVINGNIQGKDSLTKCLLCTSRKEINTNNDKSRTCCKIRIISRKNDKSNSEDKTVKEVIFFGSIFDAIKQILAPSKSVENIKNESSKIKETVRKTCSCTSRTKDLPTKITSLKSSTCKTCETASQVSDDDDSSTYISCKGIEKSQSCPYCNAANDEKTISRFLQRAKRDENTSNYTQQKNIYPKLHTCGGSMQPTKDFISKCSLCGSELSKDKKLNTTSVTKSLSWNSSETNKESLYCRKEAEPSCAHKKKVDSDSENSDCACESSENINRSRKVSKKPSNFSTCKTCQTEGRTNEKRTAYQQKFSRKQPLDTSQSCPICLNKKTTKGKGESPEDPNPCATPNMKKAKSLCCGRKLPCTNSEDEEETPYREVVMKDAATSTKRTDRYDVRPLKLLKFHKKLNCTCRSDSILYENRRPSSAKRCRSCSSYCY